MLARGFGPCHKVRHEKSNPPADGQQVLRSPPALQPHSSASGSQTGTRHRSRRPRPHVQSRELEQIDEDGFRKDGLHEDPEILKTVSVDTAQSLPPA